MKKLITFLYCGLIVLFLTGTWGCKSTKKVTEASEESTEVKEEVKETVEEDTRTEEEKRKEESLESQLNTYFDNVSRLSSDAEINRNISQAIDMFTDKDAPVFIVFYRESGQKDYDKPTTIEKHLNYLKDQKKNPYQIDRLIFDDSGKIAEIELKKR